MKNRPQECVNPLIGKQIYIEIFDAGITRRKVTLTTEHEAHIGVCPYCGPLAPIWKIKAGGWLPEVDRIFADAAAGRPGVLHRREGEVDIYFKPTTPSSSAGLLVRRKVGGDVISIDETSIESFEEPNASSPYE
jgi:hypothetical protein